MVRGNVTDAEEQPSSTEQRARKLSPRTVVIVVVAAILVLFGAGAGVYFLTSDDESGPSTAAESSGVPSAEATATLDTRFAEGPPEPEPSLAAPEEVGSAKAVAAEAIQAINVRDPEAMKKVSCDPEGVDTVDTAPPDARAEIVSEPEVTGDTATVQLKLTIGDQSTTIPLPLRKQNGTWCVD